MLGAYEIKPIRTPMEGCNAKGRKIVSEGRQWASRRLHVDSNLQCFLRSNSQSRKTDMADG
jgi:hypothetical protein